MSFAKIKTCFHHINCRQPLSSFRVHESTWREGATNAAGHGVAQGGLRPAGHDGQQQAGEPVQALAACDTVARRTGSHGAQQGALLWLPEAQDQPKPAVGANLQGRSLNPVTSTVYRRASSRYSQLHVPRCWMARRGRAQRSEARRVSSQLCPAAQETGQDTHTRVREVTSLLPEWLQCATQHPPLPQRFRPAPSPRRLCAFHSSCCGSKAAGPAAAAASVRRRNWKNFTKFGV